MLGHIVDRTTLLFKAMTGDKSAYVSMVEKLANHEAEKNNNKLMAFASNDEFEAYWTRIAEGG